MNIYTEEIIVSINKKEEVSIFLNGFARKEKNKLVKFLYDNTNIPHITRGMIVGINYINYTARYSGDMKYGWGWDNNQQNIKKKYYIEYIDYRLIDEFSII